MMTHREHSDFTVTLISTGLIVESRHCMVEGCNSSEIHICDSFDVFIYRLRYLYKQ